MRAVFDFDAVCFRSAASAQKRSIRCLHKPTNKDYEFSTRTEFYGHYKTKSGGWLAKNSAFTLEDFEITDIVEPEPVEHALKSVKTCVYYVIQPVLHGGGIFYANTINHNGRRMKKGKIAAKGYKITNTAIEIGSHSNQYPASKIGGFT